MLKLLIDEPADDVFADDAISSYEIAQRKLGGLVVDFIFIDLETRPEIYETAIIMRKVQIYNITTQIKNAVKAGNFDLAEMLIRKNVDLIFRILKRGVFLLDAKFHNFGIIKGKQGLLDPGYTSEVLDDAAIRNLELSIEQNYNYLALNLKSEKLASFYRKVLVEYGFDGPNLRQTVHDCFGSEHAIAVMDISEEVAASINALTKTAQSPSTGAIPEGATLEKILRQI